jgi:hypothetical protein
VSRLKRILATIGWTLAIAGFGTCLVGACTANSFQRLAGIGAILFIPGVIALALWMLIEAGLALTKFARWTIGGCAALWAYETVTTRRSPRYDLGPAPEGAASPRPPGSCHQSGLPLALGRNQEVRLFVRKRSGSWDEATWSHFLDRLRREYGAVDPDTLRAALEQERQGYQASQGDKAQELRAIDRLLARASAYGPPKPFRNKYLGWLAKALGGVVFGAGALVIGICFWTPLKEHFRPEEALTLVIVGFVVGLPLLLVGSCVRTLGTRLASRDAAAEVYADDRLPIVYLRSFKDDSSLAGGVLWQSVSIIPHIISRGRFARDPDQIGLTSEERLAAEFRPRGPVIAVGRPGDRLAPLGAARAYVGHDEWQAFVIDLISRASTVIVRLGTSDGLSWEIDTVLKAVPWPRLLFQLPERGLLGRKKRAAYQAFRERSLGLIGSALPVSCRGVRFISFDQSGTPFPFA